MALQAVAMTGKEYTVDDFDPYYSTEPEEGAPTFLQLIGEINAGLGGIDLRKKPN